MFCPPSFVIICIVIFTRIKFHFYNEKTRGYIFVCSFGNRVNKRRDKIANVENDVKVENVWQSRPENGIQSRSLYINKYRTERGEQG